MQDSKNINKFERVIPKISIVIPSWFTKEQHGKYGKHETYWFANECLKRLISVTPRDLYELIIVDNGSTLQTQDLSGDLFNGTNFDLEWYWSQADILIRNQKNLGFGPACNQGFAVSRGEYICCLNNDILIWSECFDALLKVFDLPLDPKVGMAMPALMKETRDAKEALGMKNIDLNQNKDQYGKGAEFGSMWIAPRELLNKVAQSRGGYYVFDEDFLLGMGEDRFLYQEIRKLGYETYRTHNTRTFHQGNLTIGKVKDRKVYTESNRLKLEEKKKTLWG